MSIVGDDGDDRRARVDRMIEEFRNARSRRQAATAAVTGDDRVADVREAGGRAAVARLTPPPTSRSNG
jgi:hypothetical protein